jgi:hypothetical protein
MDEGINSMVETIHQLEAENEKLKFRLSNVSGELVDFLTWYIHKSEFSKDTYSIKFVVDEYLKSTNFH